MLVSFVLNLVFSLFFKIDFTEAKSSSRNAVLGRFTTIRKSETCPRKTRRQAD
jgi:hypothetical protein